MTVPHNSWANVYDLAYEQTHSNYTSLLKVTLDLINETVEPPASVVDFGAGTGRLAVPLASQGYDVVAVEPSCKMLEQLSKKGRGVETVNCKMQDFQSTRQFDMALCVFTVIVYLLEEDSLEQSAAAIATSLKPGGSLLIDIPKRSIFRSYQSKKKLVERSVKITPVEDSNLFRYSESLKALNGDDTTVYNDDFQIRYWERDHVVDIFRQAELSVHQDWTERFSGSGSNYLLMTKKP